MHTCIIRNRVYKNVTVTLKKLEVTGAQLYDKQGQPKPVPPPKAVEEPKEETPKVETPKDEPKTDNETTK